MKLVRSIAPLVRLVVLALACGTVLPTHAQAPQASTRGPETERLYLSGHGPADAVDWEFFCTAGRRSRVWTTIKVPSCWEQQGFGTYNYGNEIDRDELSVGGEQGLYRRQFTVPAAWRGRQVRIVFDGAMTDTTVWVNGQQTGAMHQGAFYRFHYDITPLVKFGEANLLEVTVSKMSSNRSVNSAERAADFWVFGGLFRPVWIEGRPAASIERAAVDARADGRLSIDVFLAGAPTGARVVAQVQDAAGVPVGSPVSSGEAGAGGAAAIRGRFEDVKTWTAETPNLYSVTLTLVGADGRPLHTTKERFGFRTIEVREHDGVYLNGTKIVLKGVNRHAFWPETGRTVTREQGIEDIRLMKEANLNAVRMSHYPPDEHFLDDCDELGLYVLDELTGWQKAYGTEIGAKLAGELVRRDVNHPSILFWDNGNEGGWNVKLDGEFAKWDPQARPVLHPRSVSSGIDTLHYPRFDKASALSAGPQLFMPTEFLHGLYDGGTGAGLRDYWNVMGKSRTVAGAFMWVWSDEGVVRTDQDGRIDTAGNQAPDGMTGPHREKEGSYFTVKEIWSPIQVALPLDSSGALSPTWDGVLSVENGYDFNSLERCRLVWEVVSFPPASTALPPRTVATGSVVIGPIAPRTSGKVALDLPRNWRRGADALHVTARGPSGEELWTWSARVDPGVAAEAAAFSRMGMPTPSGRVERLASREERDAIVVTGPAGELRFDRSTGMLAQWRRGGRVAPVTAGPAARAFVRKDRAHLALPDARELVSLGARKEGSGLLVEARYRGILRQAVWHIDARSDVVRLDYEYGYDGDADLLGVGFDLPPALSAKRWLGRGPYRVYRNRLDGVTFYLHRVEFNDPVPGQTFTYPEFKGYFRDWRWLALEAGGSGELTVANASNVPFFGLYGPRDGQPAMLAFPDTGLAFLHVIPAQGTKFDTPDQLGPQSLTPKVQGVQRGSVLLRFRPR
jgi:hypothetical protein